MTLSRANPPVGATPTRPLLAPHEMRENQTSAPFDRRPFFGRPVASAWDREKSLHTGQGADMRAHALWTTHLVCSTSQMRIPAKTADSIRWTPSYHSAS